MTSQCAKKVGRCAVLVSVAALAVVASGCKSNPLKFKKRPPLMDSRGMVPPAYSEPGAKSAPSLPYEPSLGGAPTGSVLIPEEPLAPETVKTAPPPSMVVELPPVLASETLTYEVKKGDSLWKIARSYGVSHQELAAHNNMQPEATLVVGRILAIPPGGKFVPAEDLPKVTPAPSRGAATSTAVAPAAAAGTAAVSGKRKLNDNGSYTVRSGDSLWLLARDFGSTTKDIRTANNLSSDVLQIGQVLVIPAASASPAAAAASAGNGPSNPVPPVPPVAAVAAGTPPVDPLAPTPTALPNMLDYTVTEGDSLQNIADMFGVDVESIKRANTNITGDGDLRPNMNLRIPLN